MKRDRIKEAMESGENNLRTMKLIHNWCAHAKIVKHGGVGLVEQQTGLPIGHHLIECPHAPAGGMAAFDLADTAIDFYDRNCHDCMFRKPLGMPNITILIAERDKQKRARDQEQEKAARQVADKLTAREAVRAAKAVTPNMIEMPAYVTHAKTARVAAGLALSGVPQSLAPECGVCPFLIYEPVQTYVAVHPFQSNFIWHAVQFIPSH
ncbi:hypothetical protein [Rhodopseudomonas sp. P2A-2r]|uniref:hypothetical protein n=1 Tax=unclassified Rhodopseudomonas TaxID=2638247 RepID=UPI0022340611|nr:hypothetical protein [Rhodopseudomonas sp. P2A-2r]UZE49288.1 hypothetical protein ONR75_32255 [Rhodopseudomonas sp. P2A-2r]